MDGPQTSAFKALVGRPKRALLIGGAGTGKSWVLNQVIAAFDTSLKKEDWCVILCASHTACAGFAPGRAKTIASFVGAGGRDIPSDPTDARAVKMANKAFVNSLEKQPPFQSHVSVLIIDEFGLVSADQLTYLLNWCTKKCPSLAIWLAGDVGQIVRSPPVWRSSAFTAFLQTAVVLSLVINHRIDNKETTLKRLLDALRTGTLCTSPMLHVWNNLILQKRAPPGAIIVTAANWTCQKNIRRSAAAQDIELVAIHDVLIAKGKRKRIKEAHVLIGVDCRVMITRKIEDTSGKLRAQGLFATVVAIRQLDEQPIASDNVEVTLSTDEPETFAIQGQKSTTTGPLGLPVTATKLDVINAVSMTVHRLQGKTLAQDCSLDGERAMEKGGIYVWASRVTRLDQLSARNMSAERADELAPSKEQIEWADRLHALRTNV